MGQDDLPLHRMFRQHVPMLTSSQPLTSRAKWPLDALDSKKLGENGMVRSWPNAGEDACADG